MAEFKGRRGAHKNLRAKLRNQERKARNIEPEKARIQETFAKKGKLSKEDQNFAKNHKMAIGWDKVRS